MSVYMLVVFGGLKHAGGVRRVAGRVAGRVERRWAGGRGANLFVSVFIRFLLLFPWRLLPGV